MIEDDIRSILKSLLSRSRAKQVEWTSFGESPYDDDFIVSFPKSSVNLFKNKEGVITATIMNSAGTVVGSISSEGHSSDEPMLDQLFNCAKEYVFKIDETLEDLKRALASKELIGGPKTTLVTEDDIPF